MAHLEADDLDILLRLGGVPDGQPIPADLADRAGRFWDRVRHVLRRAADGAKGGPLVFELWPWAVDGAPQPFVWARYKRPEHGDCAAHIGLFLAPTGCNLALDLEKDLLDAGDARESVAQVLAFYRNLAPSGLPADDDLGLWVDDRRFLAPTAFATTDLDALLRESDDPHHPWPRLGYRFTFDDLAEGSTPETLRLSTWIDRLAPQYDALVASYGRRS